MSSFEPVRFKPKDNPEQLETCRAYARMMNTLDSSHLEAWLRDDLKYSSQWVFEDMHGKDHYVSYIRGKLNTIRKTGSRVWARIAYTNVFGAGHCVVLAQKSPDNMNATVLIEMKDDKIKAISMCGIPSPAECEITDEIPA